MKKKIPIGVSDFKKIIEEGYHYVDKSLFIKELMEDGSEVVLIPRPRRFGKTLNMTMLRYFFEKTKENNGVLFHKLKIWEHEEIVKEQGKRPVIYLTFKDIKCNRWEDCLSAFRIQLAGAYAEHRDLLSGLILENDEKQYFEDIIWGRTDISNLGNSIRKLCEFLYRNHGEKPVLLIDEYDTPIYSAWANGYYNELISFVRSLLGSAMKDNPYLGRAVLTGIMRIAKESLFSGLNNLKVSSILQIDYSDWFGFTESETQDFLQEVGVENCMPEVREWYNGYLFGETNIYNPWSILNFAASYKESFRAHWVNTGSSDLIIDLLSTADSQVKQDMEDLIKGKEIVKAVREDTVLTEIGNSSENIWSFLLFSGYLKAVDNWQADKKTMCRLKIPNKEVAYVFDEIIRHWINKGTNESDYRLMLKSLTNGDVKTFGKILRDIVAKSLSYFDVGGNEPEKFYHAFVLGIMVSLSSEYQVKSNRESGYGRYDVMLIPLNSQNTGCVLEFKKVEEDEGETLEKACDAALQQIEDKGYRKSLEAAKVTKVIEVGIAFKGKKVMVKGRVD